MTLTLSELHLKPIAAEQLEQIVELDRLCLGGLWTLEGYQRELASPNSTLIGLSAPLPDKLLAYGCFWAILEEAHITILAVHPDCQGRGLGQLLLGALLRDACQRQLERATLEVRASNQIALSLYQKFGFKIAGRRKGYYQQTGEDALILWQGDLAKPEFVENLTLWQQQVRDRLAQNQWKLVVGGD